MLFRTQIIFCSSELRLHFRIAEVGSLLSLNRAWRAQVTHNWQIMPFESSGRTAANSDNSQIIRFMLNYAKLHSLQSH